MKRRTFSRLSFLHNLVDGDYGLRERLGRVRVNLGRRTPTRTCCGNYGEPGC